MTSNSREIMKFSEDDEFIIFQILNLLNLIKKNEECY
jgi:hypothetical protein